MLLLGFCGTMSVLVNIFIGLYVDFGLFMGKYLFLFYFVGFAVFKILYVRMLQTRFCCSFMTMTTNILNLSLNELTSSALSVDLKAIKEIG